MTKQELNRDIKRLFNKYAAKRGGEATNEYFKWVDDEIKPELKRLYYADTSLKSLTADNLRRLLRLNLSLRVIEFHNFGLHIDYND